MMFTKISFHVNREDRKIGVILRDRALLVWRIGNRV